MRILAVAAVFLLTVIAVSTAQAQTDIAKYGGEFMATGFGGRALGMGGAGVAVTGDVTAAYWNPAGLMRMTYPEIGLMHEQRFGGLLSYNYGGVAWPFGPKYTLALSSPARVSTIFRIHATRSSTSMETDNLIRMNVSILRKCDRSVRPTGWRISPMRSDPTNDWRWA
jgi:hypothetical protein